MTEQIQTIEEILETLKPEAKNLEDFNRRNSACIDRIVGLSCEYDDAIRQYMQSLFSEMHDENEIEFTFQILLEALTERNQTETVFALASEALLSENAIGNEVYERILRHMDFPGTADVFVKALPSMHSDFEDELHGFAEENIIEYLMHKNFSGAYPAIMQLLPDSAPRVRASALLFIKQFDKQESAPKLIELLSLEDWHYNILLILELLQKWHQAVFLPQLKAYYEEEWEGIEDEVTTLLEKIIRDFSTSETK